jgi:hypothetical protein
MNAQDCVKAKETLTTQIGTASPPQYQSSTALFRAEAFDFALRDQTVAVGIPAVRVIHA